jgi:hypothetical protein
MAVPASEIIISLRNEDTLTHLKHKLDDKKIIGIIKDEKTAYISATKIKQLYIKSPSLIYDLINPKVFNILQEEDRGRGAP